MPASSGGTPTRSLRLPDLGGSASWRASAKLGNTRSPGSTHAGARHGDLWNAVSIARRAWRADPDRGRPHAVSGLAPFPGTGEGHAAQTRDALAPGDRL